VNAGLLLRSLQRLLNGDPGFVPTQLITMRVQISGPRYSSDSAAVRYFARVIEAVQRVPGLESVALTSQLPLSGDDDRYGVHFESSPTGRSDGEVFRYAVSPDYFRTIGLEIVRGRPLMPDDRAAAPVVVINETFARRQFPGGDAIGQHLRIGPDRGPWFTIVGIARDVRQLSLAGETGSAAYLLPEHSFFGDAVMSIVARVSGDPLRATPAIKAAIWSVDRTQAITRVQRMQDIVVASAAERRFALVLFEVFAAAALLLAATGIYGVLSASVNERTREIGVRSALGASSREIVAHVMREGMSMTAVGVGAGLLGAAASSALLASLLFGTSRLDPATYAAMVALLVAVGAVACWIPAVRASRLDPVTALKSE
jgi:putative ABC transport system permease protein